MTSLRATAVSMIAATLSSLTAQQDSVAHVAMPASLRQAGDATEVTSLHVSGLPNDRQPAEVDLWLDGVNRRLVLHPVALRSPDFEVLVDDGTALHRIPAPPSTQWRGHLAGDPGSGAAVSVHDGALRGVVWSARDARSWSIDPVRDLPGMAPGQHIVHAHAGVLAGPATAQAKAAIDQLDVGIDCSFSAFQLAGSVAATVRQAATTLNSSDLVLVRDTNTTIAVTRIIVRTTPTYSQFLTGSTATSVVTNWSQLGPLPGYIHLFTRGNSIQALGFPQGACTSRLPVGISAVSLNAVFASRMALHAIGFALGGNYCTGTEACNIICRIACSRAPLQFGPANITRIQAFKQVLAQRGGCLKPVSPVTLSTANPGSASAHAGATVTLNGQHLHRTASIDLGAGTPLPFTITSPETVTVTLPAPLPIGATSITVTDSLGATASTPFTVTGTSPPVLITPGEHPGGTTASYEVQTDKGWLTTYLVATTNQPSVLPNFVSLGIGSGFTTLGVFATATADATGTVDLPIRPPQGFGPVQLYWQAISVDPAAASLPLATTQVNTVVYR